MNNREIAHLIRENINYLKIERSINTGTSPTTYTWKNLINVRNGINNLSELSFIAKDIDVIKSIAPIFGTNSDTIKLLYDEDIKLSSAINQLKIGLSYVLDAIQSTEASSYQNTLMIKLPELKSFDDLSKVSNEFKKAIDIPVNDLNSGDEVNIITAENGSIWLFVYVGGAINLIAAICWSAAVLRKKFAEAKIFEAHAKTLELKNDSIQILLNAQNQQIQNLLQAEAEAIAEKNYNGLDADAVGRLKLSITTIADLLDRGSIILPADKQNTELKKLFPDYSQLSLIESTIKHLKNAG